MTAPPENVPGAPFTRFRLLWVPVDGSRAQELFAVDNSAITINRWQADGERLFFGVARYRTDDPGSLWSVNADGSKAQDLRLRGALVEVSADGSRIVYSPVALPPGALPELWEAVPGGRSQRLAQVPVMIGFRVFPDGGSVLVLTLAQDRTSVGLVRVAVDGGTIRQAARPFESVDRVSASFASTRALAPNGDGALIVVHHREISPAVDGLVWYDLAAGHAIKLGPWTGSLAAGWL